MVLMQRSNLGKARTKPVGPIQRGWEGQISFLKISLSDPLSRRYKIKGPFSRIRLRPFQIDTGIPVFALQS